MWPFSEPPLLMLSRSLGPDDTRGRKGKEGCPPPRTVALHTSPHVLIHYALLNSPMKQQIKNSNIISASGSVFEDL